MERPLLPGGGENPTLHHHQTREAPTMTTDQTLTTLARIAKALERSATAQERIATAVEELDVSELARIATGVSDLVDTFDPPAAR
ncbi:hypothetical protein [Occultella gossypii]|uniref:ANTAR domain-containing protein n=1 Tax=Occultella gossypii TaxID=2800820 RepID=A0ABS7S6J7_9MICO|nr:hypothetical protein [Occultella gossypii]MBZ2195975.1 hypothetical protein [Occultella gossypii]